MPQSPQGARIRGKLVVTDKPLFRKTQNLKRLEWLMKVSCIHRRVPALTNPPFFMPSVRGGSRYCCAGLGI